MITWPYLINNGFLPYRDIAIVHTPGLLVLLTMFFRLFGTDIIQLKIFTWIIIFITDLIFFIVVKKVKNTTFASLSLTVYIILQIIFDGNGLWFESLLTPLALLLYLLITKRKYFISGVLFITMFFVKQTAVWFLIPIMIEYLVANSGIRRLFIRFIYGCMFGGLVVSFFIFVFGLSLPFYEWAIKFGIFVLPQSIGQIQLPSSSALLVALFPFLTFLPILNLSKPINNKILAWGVAGTIGAYPRFEFFHLQPAMPFVALAFAIFLNSIKSRKLLKLFLGFYMVGLILLFSGFFIRNYNEGTRFYEPVVKSVAEYVSKNVSQGEKIMVLNWWDSLYVFTNTIPVTRPLVPQLSWYQDYGDIQGSEVSDLESNEPKLIILKPYETTGLAAYIPQKIYEFLINRYQLVETIDGIEIYKPI